MKKKYEKASQNLKSVVKMLDEKSKSEDVPLEVIQQLIQNVNKFTKAENVAKEEYILLTKKINKKNLLFINTTVKNIKTNCTIDLGKKK